MLVWLLILKELLEIHFSLLFKEMGSDHSIHRESLTHHLIFSLGLQTLTLFRLEVFEFELICVHWLLFVAFILIELFCIDRQCFRVLMLAL